MPHALRVPGLLLVREPHENPDSCISNIQALLSCILAPVLPISPYGRFLSREIPIRDPVLAQVRKAKSAEELKSAELAETEEPRSRVPCQGF